MICVYCDDVFIDQDALHVCTYGHHSHCDECHTALVERHVLGAGHPYAPRIGYYSETCAQCTQED